MRRKMLKKLAAYLVHDVKDEWFYLGNWASAGFKQKKCGTTACALGWATACFPRSRLKLVADEVVGRSMDIRYVDAKGNEYDGYEAAEVMFGIGYSDARYLFAPDEYQDDRTREAVASRLLLVAERGQA